jgi:class 3 adenylate cyclase
VTFLFTDLEGSTRLWEQFPEAMQSALARHDALLREAVTGHNGHVVKTTGDGVHAAFATARDAVDAAVDAQRALGSVEFGAIGELRVRMGLHTGTSEARDGDYYGSAVNRAARIMAVAHGKQIVCSQATADLVREELPHGATLLDLGEHRLRDLTAIERVFQIAADGLPADFPPLRSLGAYSSNLPLQVSAFVGRDDDLARIADLLSRERLVTITGPGGVGKTRLALQTAAATLPDYPDGSWFVDLAPVGDAEYLASEIGAAMGLPESRTGTPEDGLVRALAHRDTLVVLDNCEHVVDAVARLADIVIRRCAAVTVLATSSRTSRKRHATRPTRLWPAHAPSAIRTSSPRHWRRVVTSTR